MTMRPEENFFVREAVYGSTIDTALSGFKKELQCLSQEIVVHHDTVLFFLAEKKPRLK